MYSSSESCSSTGSRASKYSASDVRAADEVVEILRDEYNSNTQVNDAVLHSHFRTHDVPRGAVIAAQEALSTYVKAGRDHLLRMREAKRKLEMHAPLTEFIATVVDAVPDEDRIFRRQTKCMEYMRLGSDTDLMAIRYLDCATFEADQLPDHFRHVLALTMLKLHSTEGPSDDETQRPEEIIGQMADAVRVLKDSRPFQLYTLAVMICGEKFWVSVWDQAGVVISKPHSMTDEQELFIRLIISINCRMDAVDFGHNPSIQLPAGFSYAPLEDLSAVESLAALDSGEAPERFPTTRIGRFQWELRELLSKSTCALGRNTTVWRVARNIEEDPRRPRRYIFRALKLTWHTPSRVTESAIHHQIQEDFRLLGRKQPPTISKLDAGEGDGDESADTACVFTMISEIRGDDVCNDVFRQSDANLELTCLLFSRVGKSICEYETDLELLRGIRDIVKGLMAMNEAGWMHRDVSAGNCLLSCDPADGPSFVSDIELSKKMDSKVPASKTTISGTAQFMAQALLKSMENQQDLGFVHLPQHDLESLVYVLAYVVMTKECGIKPVKKKDDRKLLRMKVIYHEMFGESPFFAIRLARMGFYNAWRNYQSVVAGDGEPSVLHDVIGALLVQVNRQYPIQKTNRFLAEADKTFQPAVPMDAKLMGRLFKRGIADEKAHLKDASPDSDVDADFD